MRATDSSGNILAIPNCYISVPGFSGNILMYSLPDISDSKSAAYNDEPVIGRSFPLKTYSHSENRVISMVIHMFAVSANDMARNLTYLRALESAVYPRAGTGDTPFVPPPVCQIRCGRILGENPLCVVLKNYSVRFPIDVQWDEDSYLPYKFDIDTSWDVIYRTSQLPGQSMILGSGS